MPKQTKEQIEAQIQERRIRLLADENGPTVEERDTILKELNDLEASL